MKSTKKKSTKKVVVRQKKSLVVKKKPALNEWVTARRSKIHGNGVFAKRLIPKGTRIIEYVGDKVTKAESDRRADQALEKAGKKVGRGAVYIFTLSSRYDIDGNVSWNLARFINHACETNCEADIVRGHIWIIATQDIQKGEELHYDYGYTLENWKDHPCRCGKKTCAKYIVAKHSRWRVKKYLAKAK